MTQPGAELAIAVCVKFAVDVNELRPDPATGGPDLARARYHINEFDANALEEALRVKERHGGRIVAVSVLAQEPPREVLLRVLAAGADALYLVAHSAAAWGDASATATILAGALQEIGAVYEMREWDIVLCGDAASDDYDGQVGPRVAEALGIVPITCTTCLELEGRTVRAERSIEECVHVVEAELPVLVGVGAETNHPRLPHLRQIMDAGHKPIERFTCADLCRGDLVALEPTVEQLEITAPVSARRCLRLEGEEPEVLARGLLRQLLEAGEVTL